MTEQQPTLENLEFKRLKDLYYKLDRTCFIINMGTIRSHYHKIGSLFNLPVIPEIFNLIKKYLKHSKKIHSILCTITSADTEMIKKITDIRKRQTTIWDIIISKLAELDYGTCYRCGEIEADYDLRYYDDCPYCEHCFSDNFIYCDHCEETYPTGDTYYISDLRTHICESCYNNGDFSTCDRCENTYSDSAGCYDEDEDCWLCNNCSENVETKHQNVSDFRKCTLNDTLKFPIYTGLEIEAEANNDVDEAMYIARDIVDNISYDNKAVEDGSLSYGAEIVTEPLYATEMSDNIRQICYALRDNDFGISARCGLHVHLNAEDVTENSLKKFVRYYMLFEPFLFKMLPKSRDSNSYCMRLNGHYVLDDFDKTKLLDNSFYKETNTKYRKSNKYDSARYYALNVHSYYYRGTIEFRHHSGTLDPTKIVKWVMILHNLFHYGLKTSENKLTELENKDQKELETYFINRVLRIKTLKKYYKNRCIKFANYLPLVFARRLK